MSGWPTIPQVFVEGELIGGADIVEELEASGELSGRSRRSSARTTVDAREEKTLSVTSSAAPGRRGRRRWQRHRGR